MTNSSTTISPPTILMETDDDIMDTKIPIRVKITVLCLIMALALLGNGMLIFSIIKTKNMLKSMTNVLILNLACCDIVVVTTSVIGDIVYLTYDQFVFGEVGCRTLYPVSTYAVIAAVSSLLLICVDRYIATSYPFRYRQLKTKSKFVLICSHTFSVSCVIPYSVHSSLSTDKSGLSSCGETWSETSSYIYTIFLFLVQYGVPLPIIICLYLRTWIQIKIQNDIVVRNAENRLRRIKSNDLYNCSVTTQDGGSLTTNNNNNNNNNHKHENNHSELYNVRHKQTMDMLMLFICIVIVFAVCMLPHHIKWLYYAATGNSIGDVPDTVFYWLTYTNSVCNPFIYGIHPKFRKVYTHTVKGIANVCYKHDNLRPRSVFALSETADFAWVHHGAVSCESRNNNKHHGYVECCVENTSNIKIESNHPKGTVSMNSWQSCKTTSTELRDDEKGGSFNSTHWEHSKKSVRFASSGQDDDVFWTLDKEPSSGLDNDYNTCLLYTSPSPRDS